MDINLTPEQTATVLSKAEETSVLTANSDFNLTSSNKDKIVHSISFGFPKSHAPGGADKSEGDTTLTPIDVELENVYDIVAFNDFEAEDEAAIVGKVVDKMPVKLAKGYDAAAFGNEFWAASPFPALTTNTAEVDESADSWLDAFSEVFDAGFNPDTILLVNQARKVVKKAFAENAQTNGLRDTALTELDGIPVHFRNLKTGALEDGDVLGIVYDSSQVVTYLREEVETDYYSAKDNYSLRKLNKDAVYVGTRYGLGISNSSAAVILVYSATSV